MRTVYYPPGVTARGRPRAGTPWGYEVPTPWGYWVPSDPHEPCGAGGPVVPWDPMATTYVRPKIPEEVAKLGKIKAQTLNKTLGEYVSELITEDTRELKEVLNQMGVSA
jgi:hypothetical protein